MMSTTYNNFLKTMGSEKKLTSEKNSYNVLRVYFFHKTNKLNSTKKIK